MGDRVGRSAPLSAGAALLAARPSTSKSNAAPPKRVSGNALPLSDALIVGVEAHGAGLAGECRDVGVSTSKKCPGVTSSTLNVACKLFEEMPEGGPNAGTRNVGLRISSEGLHNHPGKVGPSHIQSSLYPLRSTSSGVKRPTQQSTSLGIVNALAPVANAAS